MNRLFERYKTNIAPTIQKEFGIGNVYAVPRLKKITVNVGVGKIAADQKMLDAVVSTIQRITGQKPVLIKSTKSISNFKLRKGMIVGVMATLRGRRMYDFLDKLINVALPRVRDFQGINPQSVDGHGTITIGFKEHIVFPEIRSDEIEAIHGLEVCITTTATNSAQGHRLLELLGMPFKKKQ
ncbi:MAG: 50S ribosomal protein L5 [Candidatus Kerfeldbacteria bacterium]|nr:50S ribosomal protein L5 [Candidatus Kerfeldbacteria bacterium]